MPAHGVVDASVEGFAAFQPSLAGVGWLYRYLTE